MKWLGYRQVSVSEIFQRAEDEIRRRMGERHVKELAQSFTDATGGEPGNALWVQKTDLGYEIVAGRDRLAALLILKRPKVWVRVGEYTLRELLLAEVHENLRRRQDDRNALLARLVDETEAEIDAIVHPPSGEEVPAPAHRPKSARQQARETVAAETGLTPKAVARADEKAAAAAAPAAPPPLHVPRVIDMLGLFPSLDWTAEVKIVVDGIQAAIADVKSARARVARIASAGTMHSSHTEALRLGLGAVLLELEQRLPVAACAHCKDPDGSEGKREICGVCLGKGYIIANQQISEADALKNLTGTPVPKRHRAAVVGAHRQTEPGTLRDPVKPRVQVMVIGDDGAEVPFVDPDEASEPA